MAAVTAVVRSPALRTAPGRSRPWLRAVAGTAILAAVVASAGTEPFLRGLAALTPAALAAAFALAAGATAAAAWRWRILATRLGLRLGWRESVAAYYRSQFLNAVLPGGIVGDVHRAVSHGRSVEQFAQATRAVAAERAVGQAVQVVLATAVLAVAGASAYAPAMVLLLCIGVLALVAAIAALASRRLAAAVGRELAMLRLALGAPGTLVRVVAASVLVVTAHVATFLVACVAVGVDASEGRVAAAAVIAVLASSIPLSVGGWGPREGAAAWAFGAAGLGSAAGIAAATAYGVLATIALAPGAVVVAASVLSRRTAAARQRTPRT
jgi:uncharacterized membrane protein YbhN (UPF0104 family)